mgnify:CR=1 FL=1
MNELHLSFDPRQVQTETLSAYIRTCLPATMEKQVLYVLFTVTDEILANLCCHSRATLARVQCRYEKGRIFLSIWDNGIPFDPIKVTPSTQKQIGGWGLYLCKKLTDEMHYTRVNQTNRLTLVKYYIND